MKGWNKDGERVDLLPWQDEEIRAYLKWAWNPDPASPYSRFMYSKQAMADEDRGFPDHDRQDRRSGQSLLFPEEAMG